MFIEKFKCSCYETCKGKKQKKTASGKTDHHCAYCIPAKERILAELNKFKEH